MQITRKHICLLYVIIAFVAGIFSAIIGNRLNNKIYSPGKLWDIALFRMDDSEDFIERPYCNPDVIFSPQKNIRFKYHYVTGYADPFLFVDGEYLYLFYEREIYDGPAPICAYRTKDLERWEDLDVVLSESHHLSYPNVFRYNGDIYMIPETRSTESVTLYKAHNFPYGWEKEKVLVENGCFVDSYIHQQEGKSFLFTTTWRSDVG